MVTALTPISSDPNGLLDWPMLHGAIATGARICGANGRGAGCGTARGSRNILIF